MQFQYLNFHFFLQDFVLKYTKKFRGSRPPDPRGGKGIHFFRTHPHAHLPDAGAPPLLLGWLWPCSQVNSALLFKLVLFSQCRFSTVVCPCCAPGIGGHNANFFFGGGHAKKNFPRFAPEFVPPNFKTVPAPMHTICCITRNENQYNRLIPSVN